MHKHQLTPLTGSLILRYFKLNRSPFIFWYFAPLTRGVPLQIGPRMQLPALPCSRYANAWPWKSSWVPVLRECFARLVIRCCKVERRDRSCVRSKMCIKCSQLDNTTISSPPHSNHQVRRVTMATLARSAAAHQLTAMSVCPSASSLI